MSRRLLAVLAACCIAALSATAVAFAHGTGGGHHRHHHGVRAGKVHRAGMPMAFFGGGGLWRASVDDLATKLDVDPATLRTAIKQTLQDERAKQLAAAGLTPDEIAALKACRRGPAMFGAPKARRDARRARAAHLRAGNPNCDPAAFRSAVAKLKAARQTRPDFDAIKNDLATDLAQKLGKTPDEVIAAVRAELDTRLTQAVQQGWLTQKGHDIALACFDDPNTCDVQALEAEIRFPGRHADSPSSDASPSDTTPPSGGGSGTMTPGGGRETSTPLR